MDVLWERKYKQNWRFTCDFDKNVSLSVPRLPYTRWVTIQYEYVLFDEQQSWLLWYGLIQNNKIG